VKIGGFHSLSVSLPVSIGNDNVPGNLIILPFLSQAQIAKLQEDLKKLLAKMPRRVRETAAELDKKIL